MTPLTEAQLLKRREARREQILAAAYKVFALRGYSGTKMSMVADEAGLSAGQLYRFFDSKEELFITLLHQAVEESTQAIGVIYQMPGSPYERLEGFTKAVLEDVHAQYPFKLVQQAHTSDEVPQEAKRLIERFSIENYAELLLPLFKEGQEAGEFAGGDPERLIASYLIVLSALATFDMPMGERHQMPDAGTVLRIVAAPAR